jgi:hypothetical protein
LRKELREGRAEDWLRCEIDELYAESNLRAVSDKAMGKYMAKSLPEMVK